MFNLKIEITENEDKTVDFKIEGHAPVDLQKALVEYLVARTVPSSSSSSTPVPPTPPSAPSSTPEQPS